MWQRWEERELPGPLVAQPNLIPFLNFLKPPKKEGSREDAREPFELRSEK
jgi:hypothetical protein